MTTLALWRGFDGGKTIGKRGSENGQIARDEEYADGARITLERGGKITPFSITCGIYGWTAHTRFFSEQIEGEEEFERMKVELARIVDSIPSDGDPQAETKSEAVVEAISTFIERFP